MLWQWHHKEMQNSCQNAATILGHANTLLYPIICIRYICTPYGLMLSQQVAWQRKIRFWNEAQWLWRGQAGCHYHDDDDSFFHKSPHLRIIWHSALMHALIKAGLHTAHSQCICNSALLTSGSGYYQIHPCFVTSQTALDQGDCRRIKTLFITRSYLSDHRPAPYSSRFCNARPPEGWLWLHASLFAPGTSLSHFLGEIGQARLLPLPYQPLLQEI